MPAVIDNRTPNFDLELPHVSNIQTDDVARLRSAFGKIDAELQSGIDALTLKADLVAGKVPPGQLPAYVDDVVEFANLAGFPITGESGKIYIAQDTGKSYRWTGSIYVVLQNDYTLPPATATVRGGVKVGAGLGVAVDGELYVVGGGGGGLPAFSEQFIVPVSNGQTVLTPAGGYTSGQIELLQNGVTLYGGGDDYTANDGTTITLTTGANTTDTFLLRKWVALSEPSVPEIATRTGTQTLTNKTISGGIHTGAIDQTGSVRSGVTVVAALDIDCSAGNYFTKTIAGNSTFTFSNVPASRAYGFTLELTHTVGTVTWPASVVWPNGTAPTLTTGRVHLFFFVTDDGGTKWRGGSSTNYAS